MVEVGSNKYSLQMQWNAQEIEENEAAFRYGLFMRTIGSIKLPGEREEGNYRFDKKQTLFSDTGWKSKPKSKRTVQRRKNPRDLRRETHYKE